MPFHRFPRLPLLPARPSLRRWAVMAAGLLALTNCMEPTGERGVPRPGGVTITSRLPQASQYQSAVLAVEKIRVTLTTFPDSLQRVDTVAVRTYPFDVNQNTITLSVPLFLSQPSETLYVHLDYLTSTGVTLFTALTQTVVTAGGGSDTQNDYGVNYVGPGANAAFMTIAPRDTTILGGTTLQFVPTAYDSSQAELPEVYVSWSTSDTSVRINALGQLTAPNNRTVTVTVFASTPNGRFDRTTVTIVPAGSAAINGRVIDAATGGPVANATLSFKDAAGNLVATATTAADGSFTTVPLAGGIYTADVAAAGYLGTTVFDATPQSGGTTLPTIPMVVTSGKGGGVFGAIRDARTNAGLGGATVEVRAGVDNTTGSIVQSTTTDTAGAFALDPPPGTYTLVAHQAGYSDGRTAFGNVGGIGSLDLSLSPVGSSETRIVLQWPATPLDLDAHLTGPFPDSTSKRFHVYFANPGDLADDPFAALDIDNTIGDGPETITLSRQAAGIYRFSVHDYDFRDSIPSSSLASSGARVDLYINGSLSQQFFVPNQPGTLWTVFELNGSVVTPKNTMSYESNSDAVTAPGVNSGWIADQASLWRDIRKHPKR